MTDLFASHYLLIKTIQFIDYFSQSYEHPPKLAYYQFFSMPTTLNGKHMFTYGFEISCRIYLDEDLEYTDDLEIIEFKEDYNEIEIRSIFENLFFLRTRLDTLTNMMIQLLQLNKALRGDKEMIVL